MRYLLIGDVHATVKELDDCSNLIDFIKSIVDSNNPDKIIFLGDQFHTHSLVHLEVQRFWYESFTKIGGKIVCLVGNHDLSSNGDKFCHSMMSFNGHCEAIVETPRILDGILFLPFMQNSKEFVKICNDYSIIKQVICHQTFDGAQYDNGFFAKDGIDPNSIPQENVIVGHIHTGSKFGKIWYPGSPRWRTRSDANVKKGIWLWDSVTNNTELFSTNEVCKAIYQHEDNEINQFDFDSLNTKDIHYLDITGTSEYIKNRLKEVPPFIKTRTFSTSSKKISIKESDGIPIALNKWIGNFSPKNGTDLSILRKMVDERIRI